MVIIEVDKKSVDTVANLKQLFPGCECFEENSFGGDDIVNFIIPLVAVLKASPVLIKWIESKAITIKYDGIEISGDAKQSIKALEKILESKKNDD